MKFKIPKIDKKLLLEIVFISFGVFLGLLLNQWKENISNEELVEKTLKNIRVEVTDNKEKVQAMLNSHNEVMKNIDELISVIDNPEKQSDFKMDLSFRQVSSSAWETAKLTKAIAQMDINTLMEIGGIYEFQEYYQSIIKSYALNNIYIRHKEIDKEFVINMKNLITALIPMENDLLGYYNNLLEKTLNNYQN